jgi:hypothetical protein
MTRSGLPAFDNSIVKPDPTLFSIDLSGTQDRGFLGHLWIDYLNNTRHLPLRICVRHSEKLDDGQRELKAQILFSHLQSGQQIVLKHRRRL